MVPIIPWTICNGVEPWRSRRSLAELLPIPASWQQYVRTLGLTILDSNCMEASNLLWVMIAVPVVGEEKMNDSTPEFWPVQPKPGSVAQQLIQKVEARGKRSASIKTVPMPPSILEIADSSDGEMEGKGLADLEAMVETMRIQIGSRPSGL